MKPQTTNQNTGTVRCRCGKNNNAYRSLAIAILMLFVAVSYAGAQISCAPASGNACPSPQYRSGAIGTKYNSDLTGSPLGDKTVLNPLTVVNMVLLFQSPTYGGCSGFRLSATSSPSIESRIIVAAMDSSSGNCDLYAYGVVGQSLGWTAPISDFNVTSSPGYAGGKVYIASEDGNLYQFDFLDGSPGWTYSTSGPKELFDSSPTTWPNLDGIYLIGTSGGIHKVNPGTGIDMWTPIPSGVFPGGAGPGAVSVSASSVSVSTCGGLYSACNMLFVAGSPDNHSPTGIVKAYNSATGNPTPMWSNALFTYPVTSSPVVSDSQGLVYVQSSALYDGRNWTGALLYALDQQTGTRNWSALPPSIPPRPPDLPPSETSPNYYFSASSPAYDESQKALGPVVIASYSLLASNNSGPAVSYVSVYNATRYNGQEMCSAFTSHPITGSSPEVVDGVIYVGTDDGYVLAFDETQCGAGNLPLIWQSSPMDSGLEGPPVVSFNRVHAVSKMGTLYIWHIPGY
jgi:outer membrane protein assembly factor BamB